MSSLNWAITCSGDGSVRAWSLGDRDTGHLDSQAPNSDQPGFDESSETLVDTTTEVLSTEELAKLLPSNIDTSQLIGGTLNEDESLLVFWDFEGIARTWDLENNQVVSQPMYHQF